jgi:hypothetical protein
MLLLYILTLSMATIDWLMSLEPHWYSTIYSIMVITGQALAALAFVICILGFMKKGTPPNEIPAKPWIDLGNMTLTFVMFWAYLSFSQYLIIWSADLPEEISWYLNRQQGGWFWLAMMLIAFQFALPFLLLLARRNKRDPRRLVRIAALLVGISLFNTFWLVEPPFHPASLRVHWLDLAAFAAVGGFWMAGFFGQLERRAAPWL